jgi:hypothetical protein
VCFNLIYGVLIFHGESMERKIGNRNEIVEIIFFFFSNYFIKKVMRGTLEKFCFLFD